MRRIALSRFALELARWAGLRRLRQAAARETPDPVLIVVSLTASLMLLLSAVRAVLWLAFGRPRRSAAIAAELAQVAAAELPRARLLRCPGSDHAGFDTPTSG